MPEEVQLESDTVFRGRVYLTHEPNTENPRPAPPGKAYNMDGELVDIPDGVDTTEEADRDTTIPEAVQPEALSDKPIPPYFPRHSILTNEDNEINTFGALEDAMGEGDVEERAERLSRAGLRVTACTR